MVTAMRDVWTGRLDIRVRRYYRDACVRHFTRFNHQELLIRIKRTRRANMEQWKDRAALVTGASSGIGAAVAKELLRHGMVVVGCGRNLERLQEVGKKCSHPERFHAVQCDLAKEEDILRMFQWVKDNVKGVDVLVNNAGVCHPGSVLHGSALHWKHMMEVNVIGLATCAREGFRSMQERHVDDGYIININSLLGHRVAPAPEMSMYAASKFAVGAITQALRLEMRAAGAKIRVTSVSPGVVETEFFPRMYEGHGEPRRFPFKVLSAEDISATVLHVLSTPPHVQVDDVLVRPINQPN